jgi:LPXTG-motif cell wall-anchored protein
MEPRFPVRATIFSEPVDVGEFMPEADGTVTVTVTVPKDLPPGEHQLVLTGRTGDANLNSVGFPFTVLDPAVPVPVAPTPGAPTQPPTVAPPFIGAPVPAEPALAPFRPAPAQTPVGGLPATGSDANRIVVLGAVFAALGLALWLSSRRRRCDRRPPPPTTST